MPRGNTATPARDDAKKVNGIPRIELDELTGDKKRIKFLWAGDPKELRITGDWATLSVKFQAVASGVKRTYTMGNNNPCLHALDAAFGGEGWEKKPATYEGREGYIWKAIVGVLESEFIRMSVIGTDGQEIPFDFDKAEDNTAAASGF